MVKRLLIDATHNEEVRVAVVNTHSLEEFDSETANKRLIKSNIYLAKVVRVEPSLQAAFVEYNNGRHGFLPFAEIHPDYYRIPIADRKMLEQSLALDGEHDELSPDSDAAEFDTSLEQSMLAAEQNAQAETVKFAKNTISEIIPEDGLENDSDTDLPDYIRAETQKAFDDALHDLDQDSDIGGDSTVGADDLSEPEAIANNEKRNLRFRYKIQEVIKRRQIMLVQVVKEERGNKGAALTTYLSLPGRYCVLMPNAGHRAGGVSRKISDNDDRRRLRSLMKEFEIPEGMSLIVRTAGQERNKSEIRRDYEYLLRVWDDIREKTIISTAPELVYAEGDLVKRAIRDIYDRDVEEVLVEGEEAYKAAKNFMKSLIPSHAKKVKLYKDLLQPIFHRFGVEEQIEKMHQPVVTLPSGGSIVINHTEALVAIDVNSGRSTRERNIDDTAVKTNLEAAAEIGRQLRLRDIGGIVVIDFIDMHDPAHIANVERKIRDALKTDRARIQVGRISQFGLLELSRQRLRPSMLENHSIVCTHCHGTGLVRSVDSLALQAIREIERTIISSNAYEILVTVPFGVDLFLLNQKRNAIVAIENRYSVVIQIIHDTALLSPEFHVEIQSERPRTLKIAQTTLLAKELASEDAEPSLAEEDDDDTETGADTDQATDDDAAQTVKKKSRRHNNRRRRHNRSRATDEAGNEIEGAASEDSDESAEKAQSTPSAEKMDEQHLNVDAPISSDANQGEAAETAQGEEGQSDKRFGNTRRRRHPYQRRQHNRTHDANRIDTFDKPIFEPKPIEPRLIDGQPGSDVIQIKRNNNNTQNKQTPRPPRENRRPEVAGTVTDAPSVKKEETKKKDEPKQSKSWLRRLLDS
ncbi:MAG: ribonuclease E/G [Pseudomonadota bacterium]